MPSKQSDYSTRIPETITIKVGDDEHEIRVSDSPDIQNMLTAVRSQQKQANNAEIDRLRREIDDLKASRQQLASTPSSDPQGDGYMRRYYDDKIASLESTITDLRRTIETTAKDDTSEDVVSSLESKYEKKYATLREEMKNQKLATLKHLRQQMIKDAGDRIKGMEDLLKEEQLDASMDVDTFVERFSEKIDKYAQSRAGILDIVSEGGSSSESSGDHGENGDRTDSVGGRATSGSNLNLDPAKIRIPTMDEPDYEEKMQKVRSFLRTKQTDPSIIDSIIKKGGGRPLGEGA